MNSLFLSSLYFLWSLYRQVRPFISVGAKVDMKLDGGKDEQSLGSVVRPATDTMSIFKVQITPHYH